MLELSVTGSQSPHRQVPVTEQPNRLSRWWMRHYRHIGLACMAGSALLVCIIAVIVLPIAIRDFSNEEQCISPIVHLTNSSENTTMPSNSFTTTPPSNTLPITAPTVSTDLLCAANATWKSSAMTIAGSLNGSNSPSRTDLNSPNDLLVDVYNNLFIADGNNHRIVCWLPNATEGRIVAGTGVLGSWINLFKYPAALVAWQNQLYVSDLNNYRILAFPLTTTEGSPNGITVVGRYGAGSVLNQISSVYYMSVDKVRGLFYLSDCQNHRLLNLNLTDNTLQLLVGTGIAGSDNVSLNLPLGITVNENDGALYVADSENHRIQKFNYNSTQGMTVAGGSNSGQSLSQLYLPSGVALDSTGNVYVADSGNHRIVQWLVGAQQGRIIAGTGIPGASQIQLNKPVQLKFDVHNNLYVVDQNNNRIQRFDLLYNGC